jgi:TetR/AcrR family transcriptional regulator, transcriptional repressor for nem operon
MRCFWAAGCAATSVCDLGDAMGLGAASLCNAFGDRRTLFTQSLDRYLDVNMPARITRVERTLPPRRAIATFLTEIVERSLEIPLGCLLANAAPEVAPHDPDIADVAAERTGELEAFFRRCAVAAQKVLSQISSMDDRNAGSRVGLFCQGIELLRGAELACEQRLAVPDHVHLLDPGERHGGTPEGLEPQHRSHQSLDGSVILLNNVVEIFDLTDLGASFVLGVTTFDRRCVGAALVDRDLLGRTIMPDRLAQKP